MSAATPLDAEIIAPSGGAALWRRRLFESLNGFDEDFFAYLEDVDLGFRARLAGARGRYVPEGIVYHLGAGSSHVAPLASQAVPRLVSQAVHDNPDVVRWVARNKIWLWARCLPTRVIIRHAPSLALGLIKSAAHHILRSGQGAAFFAGTMQGLAGLPHALQKRKIIQSTKAVTDREVGKWIKTASRSW
jgi:GT2 family glycosyltransferase